MKKLLVSGFCVCLALMSCLTVYADEWVEETEDVNELGDELGEIVSGLPDISGAFSPSDVSEPVGAEAPEQEPAMTEPALDSVMPLDVTYGGAWNGAVLDYFSGVMRSHPFKDYLCFRRDQYTYVLYFGTNIDFNGSTFSGSGLNLITYNSSNNYQQNEYISTLTGQSMSYNADGIYYTNVSDFGARLEGVNEIEWIAGACVMLGVYVGISLIRGIFK